MTKICKGRDGWAAKTNVPLYDAKVLNIETSKGSRGLSTSVICMTRDGAFLSWDLMGDYRVSIPHKERCTEKAVIQLHAAVLAKVDTYIAEAKAHYAAKQVAA